MKNVEQDNGFRICEEGKVVVLKWVVKVRIIEKVRFEQRLEAGDGRSQMALWRNIFPVQVQLVQILEVGACLLCLKSRKASMTEVE